MLISMYCIFDINVKIQGTADLSNLGSKHTADMLIATASALWERDPRPTETMNLASDGTNEAEVWHGSAPAERVPFLMLVSDFL